VGSSAVPAQILLLLSRRSLFSGEAFPCFRRRYQYIIYYYFPFVVVFRIVLDDGCFLKSGFVESCRLPFVIRLCPVCKVGRFSSFFFRISYQYQRVPVVLSPQNTQAPASVRALPPLFFFFLFPFCVLMEGCLRCSIVPSLLFTPCRLFGKFFACIVDKPVCAERK